jgi:hypothetical protein
MRTPISLPDWTPKRLLYEAAFYYNLRHPDDPLDEETSPWTRITGAILNFLRHEFTDYDAELDASVYDPEKRDGLVDEVAKAAFRKYRWLKKDPRETSEFDSSTSDDDDATKPLNRRAARLAEFRGYASAIERYLDTDCPPARREDMTAKLEALRRKIDRDFDIFTPIDKEFTKGDFRQTRTGKDYDFFGHRLFPNRWKATEVTCPVCRRRIVRTKAPLNLGQNRRMHVITCYCVTGMIVPPPPGKGFIELNAAKWGEMIEGFKDPKCGEVARKNF